VERGAALCDRAGHRGAVPGAKGRDQARRDDGRGGGERGARAREDDLVGGVPRGDREGSMRGSGSDGARDCGGRSVEEREEAAR